MTALYIRVLFRSAGIFNGLAVVLLVPAFGLTSMLGLHGIGTGIYDHIGLMVIGAFGFGYWRAAGDPVGQRSVIVLGAWLKLGVVVLVAIHCLAGWLPPSMALLVSGDLIYAGLFLHYLLKQTPAR
jgi:hypothetical protein